MTHRRWPININYSIENAKDKITSLEKINNVKAATARIVSPAMASSAVTGVGIFLKGVDVSKEQKVTNIKDLIIEGGYFEKKVRNPVVVGKKLTEKLKLKF